MDEVEEVLGRHRPHTGATDAAMKVLSRYASQKAADVRALREKVRAVRDRKGG